ncbi:MAG: NUDIX hydrolase [Candidatus Saccharimonadales bacterium]
MRVAGCFLEHDGTFVLVHRRLHKPEGGTWGLPGGKVESDETDLAAISRELFEETGYQASDEAFELLGEYEFTSSEGNPFTYVTYRVVITEPHDVVLEESAHSEYKWMTIDEADAMDTLIFGLHDLFRFVGFVK